MTRRRGCAFHGRATREGDNEMDRTLWCALTLGLLASLACPAEAQTAPVEIRAMTVGGTFVETLDLSGGYRDATLMLLNTTNRPVTIELSLTPSKADRCALTPQGPVVTQLQPRGRPVPVTVALSPDSSSCTGVLTLTTAGAPAVTEPLTYDSFMLGRSNWLYPLLAAIALVVFALGFLTRTPLGGGVDAHVDAHDAPPFASFTGLTSAAGSATLFTLFSPPKADVGMVAAIALFALPILLAPLLLRLVPAALATGTKPRSLALKAWYVLAVALALFGVVGQVMMLDPVLQRIGLDRAVGAAAAQTLGQVVPAVVAGLVILLAFRDVARGLRGKAARAGRSQTVMAFDEHGIAVARSRSRWFVV